MNPKESSVVLSLRGLFWTLLSVCLTAFPSAPPALAEADSRPQSRLEKIIESGELRVGLTGSQPPLNMKNKSGEIVGLEVDLINALASAMKLEVRFKTMAFAKLLPALDRGEVDLVISGMTITPERNAKVAFAGPYFITGKSVLAKSDVIEEAADISALNNPKRTYTSVAGSTSEEFVQDVLPRAKLVTTKDHEQAVQMVIDGKADAHIADFQICAFAAWKHPEAGLEILQNTFTVEPLGIALPADDPLLVNLVTNYLKTLEYTGLLGQFKAKWLSPGSWLDEIP